MNIRAMLMTSSHSAVLLCLVGPFFNGSKMVFATAFCRLFLSAGPLLLMLEREMVANGQQGIYSESKLAGVPQSCIICPLTGVFMELMGVTLFNNSFVDFDDIPNHSGTGGPDPPDNALLCLTTFRECCNMFQQN